MLPSGDLEITAKGGDPDDTITVILKLVDATTGSVRFAPAMGRDAMVVKPITVHKIESKSS
ncbi:MAG TPA: hypothetical protein VMU28_07530 [Terriglobales bacterium]|nr:hypothetical protein [Terriglobales bacterium]